MDEEGEEPFVPLDSLLEVNLVEDTTGRAAALTKTDAFKDCGQGNRPNSLADVSVDTTGYAKSTGLNNGGPPVSYSNFDPVQIAWGMDMEEDMFYKDLFRDVSTVKFLRLHCTVCDTHLGCKPGSVLMRHVRLGTLLCKDCFTFYGAGAFPVAEDGSESFCYWCGQGGNVICCSSCPAVFCKKCIKRNYTKSTIKEIETSPEWLCFVCNYRSLWEHRAVCRAAITYESSDLGFLKEAEEKESPGHNQEFCCGPNVERRIPRLKSGMPSEVTFGEYIKAGRVKSSIMRMLKNISLDSTENLKTEKIMSTDSQETDTQKNLTDSSVAKEMVSSEESVTANHTNKERTHTPVASHNISYVGIRPLINQAHFSGINSQATTGLQFLNQEIRPNIISSSQTIPSSRVVVMPPVHIPQNSSGIRLPQQNVPVDALSLGALLSSSPPVGPVPQPSNPVFRFQSRPSPLVFVRKTDGGFVPMYVNNNASFHYLPKESSQVSGEPHYVQNQGTSPIISHPSQQQEKPGNSIKFPPSSGTTTTHKPNINGHISQNVSGTTAARTEKSSVKSILKPKTKKGYIQVRSPSALQSVTVSDIVHSPQVESVSGTGAGVRPRWQALETSIFANLPEVKAYVAREKSRHASLLAESHLKSYPDSELKSRPTSSTTNVETTSLLKNILSDVSPGCSASVKDTSSSKDISQPHQTCPELPSNIDTKWFKENLLEAENVAKYMLTRITCVQEELDSKSHEKKGCDDLINNFNKLLEIAGKKLADVNRNFTANLLRWKALASPSCHTDISQGSSAKTDKQSSVKTVNGHNNALPHEEVQVISVRVNSKRKRPNSASQVTCTGLNSAIAQDARSGNAGLNSAIAQDARNGNAGLNSAIAQDATSGNGGLNSAIAQDATSGIAGLDSAIAQDSTSGIAGLDSAIAQDATSGNAGLNSAIAQDAASGEIRTDSSDTAGQVPKPINTSNQPRRIFTRRSKSRKPASKCCSSCEPDQHLNSKQVASKNMGASRVKTEKLRAQENFIPIPEKRQKLKDLRIVLERIPNPGKPVFKRELTDTNSTSNSNSIFLVKDRRYIGPDDPVKELKPCSVVIHRLNEREITHCI